jgi:hypothetical protein
LNSRANLSFSREKPNFLIISSNFIALIPDVSFLFITWQNGWFEGADITQKIYLDHYYMRPASA